jgi:hypothetical protein
MHARFVEGAFALHGARAGNAHSKSNRSSYAFYPAFNLLLLVIGALPSWPYSTAWRYYPSGLGLVLLIVLLVILLR